MHVLSLFGPHLTWMWQHPARACVVGIVVSATALAGQAQDKTDQWKQDKTDQWKNERLPPTRDLFIPYAPKPAATEEARLQQVENVEQIKILAEMNSLTVELVKRRSDPTLAKSDTPELIKRLKELAKKLREHL